MIIDCISDLHGHYPILEGGDLLIVAGDLTARDTLKELDEFNEWIREQKYKKKVLIAGNHDNLLTRGVFNPDNMIDGSVFLDPDIDYLCDSGTEFEGLKIWGSPWTKTFPNMNPNCKAFTCETEKELAKKWEMIPHDTNILITHSPSYGILDGIENEDGTLYHAGSKSLYAWLKYIGRPRLHCFGHIHEYYGREEVFATYEDKMMISVNASHVNERYQPVNKPVRVVL